MLVNEYIGSSSKLESSGINLSLDQEEDISSISTITLRCELQYIVKNATEISSVLIPCTIARPPIPNQEISSITFVEHAYRPNNILPSNRALGTHHVEISKQLLKVVGVGCFSRF